MHSTATSPHHREDRLDANFAILWSKCISFLPIKTKKQTSDPTKQTQTLQFYRLILLANSMSPCTSTSMRRPIQRRQVIRVSSFSPTHERHGSHFKYSKREKCQKNYSITSIYNTINRPITLTEFDDHVQY